MKEDLDIIETKIKYLLVINKVYEVTNIDWLNLSMEAIETDLTVDNISEDMIFYIADFGEFQIKLQNLNRKIEVINFEEWKENRGRK